MGTYPTLLKRLVCERHWRAHPTFLRQYDKAAATVDPALVGRGPSAEQWERWLAGRVKTRPRSAHCRVLEYLFPGYTVDRLLGAYAPEDDVDGVPAGRRSGGAAGVRTGDTGGAPDGPAGWHTIRPDRFRRDRPTIGPGGGVAAGQLADLVTSEPDELHAALERGTVSEHRLSHLEGLADRLGIQVVKVPPADLLADAVTHFRSVRRLLRDRQNTAGQIRLIRTGARLATVVAEILFNSGHFGLADQWYVAARRAATDVGDKYLADIALAGNAYLPTYSDDPHGVLAMVDPRLEGRAPAASPAVAWLWGAKARAHAMLGERVAFRFSVDRARHALEAAPEELSQPGIFSFLPEKLAFYEANGCGWLRDVDGALAATGRALDHYDLTDSTEPALVRLEKASALAQSGDLAEACRVACAAVLDRHTYFGASVRRRAARFDRLLGQDPTPPVADWREIVATLTRAPLPALDG